MNITMSPWVSLCIFITLVSNLGVLLYVLEKHALLRGVREQSAEERVYAALDSNSIEFIEAVFIYDAGTAVHPELRQLLIQRAQRLRAEEARLARLDTLALEGEDGDDEDDDEEEDEDL